MTRPASRKRLLLRGGIVALILLDAVLLFAFTRRVPASTTRWSEVTASDPRVAPVFATLEERGLSAALDSLERQAARDSIVLRGGHQLAHALGRHALVSSGGAAWVIGQCRPVLGSGCYHGVIEALLQLRGRIDMAELEQMCAGVGSKVQPGPVHECVHGLGHGVLGAVALDVRRALRHCDALARASSKTSCHEGVFMEAVNSAVARPEAHGSHSHESPNQAGAERMTIDPNNPYSPCDQFADPYARSCWIFQGFVILRATDFDPGKALGVCSAAPDGRAGRCYESVGHQLTGLFQRSDAWVIEQCGTADRELAAQCAAGAALALASMDWSGERVAGFCAAVPDGWKGSCHGAAADGLALVSSSDQQAAFCSNRQPRYSEICLELTGPPRGS